MNFVWEVSVSLSVHYQFNKAIYEISCNTASNDIGTHSQFSCLHKYLVSNGMCKGIHPASSCQYETVQISFTLLSVSTLQLPHVLNDVLAELDVWVR